MCGILGYFSEQNGIDPKTRLSAAVETLRHRGPDDRGLEHYPLVDGGLWLGHTRLAIIDLSPGGHQPMASDDGRFALVFNGEIYNYRELREELAGAGHRCHSESDTEVLLRAWEAWGDACLPRLKGMFAFAILDRKLRKLSLARDAFGIKPLFFAQASGQFTFASELPALLKALPQSPRVNLQRAYEFLAHGLYDGGADTFYQEIKQLPPGHVLHLPLPCEQVPAAKRWWKPSITELGELKFLR